MDLFTLSWEYFDSLVPGKTFREVLILNGVYQTVKPFTEVSLILDHSVSLCTSTESQIPRGQIVVLSFFVLGKGLHPLALLWFGRWGRRPGRPSHPRPFRTGGVPRTPGEGLSVRPQIDRVVDLTLVLSVWKRPYETRRQIFQIMVHFIWWVLTTQLVCVVSDLFI